MMLDLRSCICVYMRVYAFIYGCMYGWCECGYVCEYLYTCGCLYACVHVFVHDI